jgi:dipeptidyl aminopeptidase/acylaminoacyl peptidase
MPPRDRPPGCASAAGGRARTRADRTASPAADVIIRLSAFGANLATLVGHDSPMNDNLMASTGATAGVASGTAGAVPASDPPAPALPQVPFGAWPSPITAEQVAASRTRLTFPTVIGPGTWWQEERPDEAGRTTIMYCGADGSPTALLPAPWSARTRVHEYGGQSYLPVPGTAAEAGEAPRAGAAGLPIVFANFADQRLYLAAPGVAGGTAEPVPLTPDPAKPGSAGRHQGEGSGRTTARPGPAPGPCGLRYADLVLSPDKREIWCVRERHQGDRVTRAIVAVPLDGSAAADPAAIRVLASGNDFFAYPTPSPDGRWLAWICWNHPHMPWDGTELRVAPVENGVPGKGRLIKGSNRESVLAPLWRDNDSLYVATDWTGWWNIYQIGLHGEPPQALYPADEEFAEGLWQLGNRPFGLLSDGRLAVKHGRGGARLGLLDPETSELVDLSLPRTEFTESVSADGTVVVSVAGSPVDPISVVRVDVAAGTFQVLRSDLAELPDRRYLPVPRNVELEGPYGRVVHALVYPPTNPDVTAPPGERPPYVVWVHGGPTSHSVAKLSLEKAYFTSRGIGIIDVNYGGSTGFGRMYRNRLNREWGIVDVADVKEAARSLARAGEADGARLAIRGGSAGGWTALAAVTTGAVTDPVFSAAVSYYGVADLREFARHTHDFESRYLDGLIGPLPGFDTVYIERAPYGHINANTCPVLLLQGVDDPVVPRDQAEAVAADLAAHGITHGYLAFEGESHGFRKAESIITAVQAELSFYGQVLGFRPRGVPTLKLTKG